MPQFTTEQIAAAVASYNTLIAAEAAMKAHHKALRRNLRAMGVSWSEFAQHVEASGGVVAYGPGSPEKDDEEPEG